MNSKQYQYVILLSEIGNFSRTAETLGISQPAFSKYIKNIENEIGTTLFVREDGSVSLTDEGTVFVQMARQIMNLEGNLNKQLEDVREFKSGTIRIAVSPFRALCILPRVIRQFHERYPGIQVIIDDRKGRALLESVERGEYDLCISEMPIASENLRFERVFREDVLLAVSPRSHCWQVLSDKAEPNADGYPRIDFRALAGMDFITLSPQQTMQKILTSLCSQYDTSVTPVIVCHSVETQLALVMEGLGCALIPSSLIAFHEERDIRFFSFLQDIPYREIAVVYRKDQYLTEPMRFLKKLLLGL